MYEDLGVKEGKGSHSEETLYTNKVMVSFHIEDPNTIHFF